MKLQKPVILLLLSSLITASSSIESDKKPDINQTDSYKSGLEKIKAIMLDEHEGIPADYQENSDDYAQTRNIAQDLNIDAMVKFFGCSTSMCETYLKEAFEHPFSSQGKDRMLQRQRIIRLLVENPELKAEVDAIIADAKEEELGVFKLFSEAFKGEHCPLFENIDQIKKKNPIEAAKKYDESIKSNNYYLMRRLVFTAINIAIQCGINTTAFGITSILEFIKEDGFKLELITGIAVALGAIEMLPNYLLGQSFYKDYSLASKKRGSIVALNHMVALSAEIEALGEEYNFTPQYILKNSAKSEDIQKFIDDIKNKRYTDKNTRLFTPQFVHNFLYTIYKNEEHLAKIFASIGEIDALNAIATKIIEYKDSPTPFCFSEIIESERPAIEAQGLWNVFIKNPVPNNLSEEKNIILTGPNAGGKTTVMRSLLWNIIFAQMGGFATGKKFSATFFDFIHSYFNITDDLGKGESLMMAEIERGKEVNKKVKSLEGTNKKFICMFDELFSGTSEKDGKRCAYEFFKNLFQSEHMLCICATHFNKLKKLEKEKNSNCVNYKIDPAVEDQGGKFKHPYTLSPGANTQSIGYEMAKKAGLFD